MTPPLRRKADWETIHEENEENLSPRNEIFAPTGRSLNDVCKNILDPNKKKNFNLS